MSETVDHENEREVRDFRHLAATLFGDSDALDSDSEGDRKDEFASSAPTSKSHFISTKTDANHVGRMTVRDILNI